MKGASGANLSLKGDWAIKTCLDATEQVDWFTHAEGIGLVPGIRLPKTVLEEPRRYRIEFIEGHEATKDFSLAPLKLCLKQVMLWSNQPSCSNGTWDGYLLRLEDHVKVAGSPEMKSAMIYLERAKEPPSSFCHGDLTLENVLIANNDQKVVVIDPNFKRDLFQSFILDLGKLLQSTHANYHRVFNSHHGVNLSRHDSWLTDQIKGLGLWEQSYAACISHIVRLRKYRPESQQHLVDQLLSSFLKAL